MTIVHRKSEQVATHDDKLGLVFHAASPEGRAILGDAEDVARQIRRKIDDVLWALDTARSKLRKAQPTTGYRSNPAIGDKPWNVEECEKDVWAAEVALLRLIHSELDLLTPIA